MFKPPLSALRWDFVCSVCFLVLLNLLGPFQGICGFGKGRESLLVIMEVVNGKNRRSIKERPGNVDIWRFGSHRVSH